MSKPDNTRGCQSMPRFPTQKRLKWYGHIRRSEEDNLSRKMMDIIVPGKRRRERPRRRWIDNTQEDMKYELTADMTEKNSTGKWWWRPVHKDVDIMVSKVKKGEKDVYSLLSSSLLPKLPNCHIWNALVTRAIFPALLIVSIKQPLLFQLVEFYRARAYTL